MSVLTIMMGEPVEDEDKKKRLKKIMMKKDFLSYLTHKKEFTEWMMKKGKKNALHGKDVY